MSDRWKVNDGTQVKWKGKLHAAGEEFAATEEQVTGAGLTSYVSKVRQQAAPKGEDKAVRSPQARDAKSDK
jgi:hypothetical protein